MPATRLKHLAIASVCAALLSAGGCREMAKSIAKVPQQNKPRPVSLDEEPQIDLTGKSPDELRELIEFSAEEADRMGGLLETGVNYEVRLAQFKRHVDTALAAAEATLDHEAATPEEKKSARLTTFRLLYSGSQYDRACYEPQLAEAVARLKESDPGGEATAVGEAILLQLTHVAADTPRDETMAALTRYAQEYPRGPAGPQLFLQYGQRLEREDEDGAALSCYRKAVELFPRVAQTHPLRQRLARLESVQRTRLRKEADRNAKRRRIRAQLGPADSGYYVIYSREMKPPKGIMTLYRFEYEVLQGPETAVAYILGLSDNWQWELVARFPETSAGYQQAQTLAEERIKKETFMKTF